jgi:hypothetical protein
LGGWKHRILGDPGTRRWRWVIMAVQVFLGSELRFITIGFRVRHRRLARAAG